MNDEQLGDWCAITVILASVALAVAWIIHGATESAWREDAVKHNKAEFYLDQKNERQWRWKE